MAYINKEKAAEIRANLKAQFPSKDGWKFSVTIEHYSSLRVAILEAPIDFTFNGEYETERKTRQLNHFYLDREEQSETLIKISAICNAGNHDRSDSMTDYFDVGWYFDFQIGKWDRPFVCTAKSDSEEVALNRVDIQIDSAVCAEIARKSNAVAEAYS